MQKIDVDSREARAKEVMEGFFKEGFKIFIDTCSILHFASESFFMNIIPMLDRYGTKIILPLRCCEEIEKHSRNKNDPKLAEKASDAIKKICQLISAKYIEIRGEKSDNFADNVFLTVFTKFRMNYNLLLITQDNNLARDILALNDSKSVSGKKIAVMQINQYGYLSKFYWEQAEQDKAEPDVDAFKVYTSITSVPDDSIKVQAPSEGESVFTSRDGINIDNGTIRLGEKIADGGEGIVYETNTPYVAKIYKDGKLTTRKREKLKLMLTKEIKCDGVCYPVCALFNAQKQFVGYLMLKAKGIEIAKSVFQPMLISKRLPGWKKRDMVELCVTILEKIAYLHQRNIILGDINPANILVSASSPKEVCFVDTDSYQIENFPCPVGTTTFTAPEIQKKHFDKFLRTMGNEEFAIATLLFMIMLPGKSPYAQQGGGSPEENIIRMDFSYPLGGESNKKTPDGKWRFMWSHLTYDIKKMFYHTFRIDGEHSAEDKRYSVQEWLSAFRYYLELLDSGKFGQQDEMSEDIFPTRFKKNPKLTYVRCKLCGNEIAEDRAKNGYCRDCLNKGETYKCKKCGKNIVYTNYQKLINGGKKHELCQDCYESGNKVKMVITCVDCGKSFEITNHEYDYYSDNNLAIPKRCKSCRDKKKNQSFSNSTTYIYSNSNRSTTYTSGSRNQTSSHTSSSKKSQSSSSGSFCFITTAVCEQKGKGDNCTELNTLRAFRDNWLSIQPGGQELITEYYNAAPLIVSRLKASPQYDMYCEKLWSEYITPCLSMIEEGRYDDCKQKYIDMIRYMQNVFCNNNN